MKSRPPKLAVLYVEGPDDISTVAGLLKRRGYDTEQGQKHLHIKPFGSLEALLDAMPDTIKAERTTPCGFVLDIDIEVKHRWQAVAERLKFTGDPMTKLEAPVEAACPANGYIGRVQGYPHPFGVWLMPDCVSSEKKLEDLIATLIPAGHPLDAHAEKCTDDAAKLIDSTNLSLTSSAKPWTRFSERDRIKARVRAWLAWQREPGLSFGAAINDSILSHDSVEAQTFMDWLARLYGFTF